MHSWIPYKIIILNSCLAKQSSKAWRSRPEIFLAATCSRTRLPTIQYPEERQTLAEAVRNFPFLVYDGDDWKKGLRCVACQICEKECPPKCIYIEKSRDKKPNDMGKAQFYPAVFDIDTSVCMSCQICVEVAPLTPSRWTTNLS